MKRVKKITTQFLTMLPLAVMGLFLLNNTLFTHTHILPSGRILVHAHPMKMAGSFSRATEQPAGSTGNATGLARGSTAAANGSFGVTTGSVGSEDGTDRATGDLSGASADSGGKPGNTGGKTGPSPGKNHHTHSQLEYTYLDTMSQEFQVFSTLLALIIPMMIIQFHTRHRNAVSHLFGHLPQGRAPPAVV